MIDSQYIFPATLSALTILATVLNFTAHFSNGEYLSWKAFNRISLATYSGAYPFTFRQLIRV